MAISPVYVAFDGDEDRWAYEYMRGWKANRNVDFDFNDAHDLDTMTSRASDEAYVKSHLRERMRKSSALIVIVGEKTKNLYKYIRWEIELALELKLPIVVVNLNNKNGQDGGLCPPILRDACAVHIPFKLAAIKHAIHNWPAEYAGLDAASRNGGSRQYSDTLYATWMK